MIESMTALHAIMRISTKLARSLDNHIPFYIPKEEENDRLQENQITKDQRYTREPIR